MTHDDIRVEINVTIYKNSGVEGNAQKLVYYLNRV